MHSLYIYTWPGAASTRIRRVHSRSYLPLGSYRCGMQGKQWHSIWNVVGRAAAPSLPGGHTGTPSSRGCASLGTALSCKRTCGTRRTCISPQSPLARRQRQPWRSRLAADHQRRQISACIELLVRNSSHSDGVDSLDSNESNQILHISSDPKWHEWCRDEQIFLHFGTFMETGWMGKKDTTGFSSPGGEKKKMMVMMHL